MSQLADGGRKGYTRVILADSYGEVDQDNEEILRRLATLGEELKTDAHPKGGMRVWFSATNDDELSHFIERSVALGILHVI